MPHFHTLWLQKIIVVPLGLYVLCTAESDMVVSYLFGCCYFQVSEAEDSFLYNVITLL